MNKGEIYFREFKDIFNNPDMYLQDDGLDLMYEFTTNLLHMTEIERRDILQNIKSNIEDYRQSNDKCLKCGEDLVIISKKDNEMLEHFGTQCRQTIYIKKCPYCGWTED